MNDYRGFFFDDPLADWACTAAVFVAVFVVLAVLSADFTATLELTR